MNGLRSLCLACILVVLAGTSARAQTEHRLVDEGKATSAIVIADEAAGCVPMAARELADGIRAMTGAEVPVERVSAATLAQVRAKLGESAPLLIGRSAWTDELGIAPPAGTDAFVIRTHGNAVAVVGNDAAAFGIDFNKTPATAGTYYGVIRLLERMGARFYLSAEEFAIMPQRRTLELGSQDIAAAPYFRYRLAERGSDPWRRRAGYGGDIDLWATRHTFVSTYNWQKLFTESHPEYFSFDRNNILSNNLYMIGFPHAGVVDEIVKQAREYFASDRIEGKRRYFLVIQNDYFMEACACEACQALVDNSRGLQGRYSNYVADAAIKVAEAVKDEFPDARIVYCAYEQYKLPPTLVKKLPPNMAVLIAQHRGQDANTEAGQRSMNELVEAWQALEPAEIGFCRYYMNGSSIIPRLQVRGIAANIRDMKRLNVTGRAPIVGEMHFTRSGHWWFELNEYVTARCLWNPDLDIETLLRDFCADSFGPAAAPMGRYIDLLEQYNIENPERGVFAEDQLQQLGGLVEEAVTLAAEDPYRRRVNYIAAHFRSIEETMRRMQSVADEAAAAATAAAVPEPVLAYDFDISLSEVISDATAHQRHGILVNGRRTREGAAGKAIDFDGHSAYIKLRQPLQVGETYTLEAWINPREMDRREGVIGEDDVYRPYHVFGSTAYKHNLDQVSLSIRDNKARFHDQGVGTVAASSELPIGTWSHLVATYSSQRGMRLFVNGELVAFSGPKERRPGTERPLLQLVGATGGISSRYDNTIADCRGFFHGTIDGVRIFDVELTQQAIRQRLQARADSAAAQRVQESR